VPGLDSPLEEKPMGPAPQLAVLVVVLFALPPLTGAPGIGAAEKALDDLLEEARRANVPPGWLR